jgi:hypothetical protein
MIWQGTSSEVLGKDVALFIYFFNFFFWINLIFSFIIHMCIFICGSLGFRHQKTRLLDLHWHFSLYEVEISLALNIIIVTTKWENTTKYSLTSWRWWHIAVVRATWRLRQEHCKFEASLGNLERSCSKQTLL